MSLTFFLHAERTLHANRLRAYRRDASPLVLTLARYLLNMTWSELLGAGHHIALRWMKNICAIKLPVQGYVIDRRRMENGAYLGEDYFERLPILLHKPSQDTTRKVFTFVPTQDWSKKWTDEDLYAKSRITLDERSFSGSQVRAMDVEAKDNDE